MISRRRNDDGAVALIVAILAVVITGMAAFAVDLGYGRATQQQLRTSADAAALAGARVLAEAGVYCDPTGNLVYPKGHADLVNDQAIAAAENYDAGNREQGFSTDPATVAHEVADPACRTFDGLWYPSVNVTNEQRLDTLFGSILGQDTLTPRAEATALVQAVAAQYAGLRPYGVCETSGLSMMQSAGDEKVTRIGFAKGSLSGPCLDGRTPGNWGILDFENGRNGTPLIEEWTQFGYRDPIPLPLPWVVEGNPGNFGPGALEDELNSIVGKDITLPVYDIATGNGANAEFSIVNFVTVKFCGWRDSKTKFSATDGCPDLDLHNPQRLGTSDTYFDVLYLGMVTVDDLNKGCQVSGDCDSGGRSIRLGPNARAS